ncbi:MAG: small ribosomal subunit Rsm22 family protein [Opitutaceae bacterium]|nr:small ribosomal subunit Rsm22 family protein [Opitutaceae bacterium]
MTWSELDWPALDRLRQKFLSGSAHTGPYWETPADLASYDLTYGERIGWKWDQVLRELRLRSWRPASREIFDWGCGSGVAARRVISCFGAESFDALTVWDHSPLACDFAEDAARRAFPALRVATATPGLLAADAPIGLLVLSHVLNELPTSALSTLRSLIARAEAVLWVEPGTHAVSRQLTTLRDELRGTFSVVAPCTHAGACPMAAPENYRHWCHFFAPPPAAIYADPEWVKFGQRAGIDLRSLPYCFLALDRRAPASTAGVLSRVIGRPEHFKPYARLLNCDATGLAELELPKRADPALFKELDRTKAPLVYRWQREGEKILGGAAYSRAGL